SCTNANGTWTLTYLAQAGENPNASEVVVPQQSQLLVANGLQHVTFQGITFAHDNWMPPAEGFGDQQGMVGVSAAVSFTNSNTITHNEIHDFYNGAIGVGLTWGITGNSSLTHDNVISYNLLYNLGQGVTDDMAGVYFASSATTGNQVLNNVIHDVTHAWQDPD